MRANLENYTYGILDRSKKVFAKCKNGHIFPLDMYVKINPSFYKELTFIAVMRKIVDPREYLFVRPDGRIDAATLGMFENLMIG
jgi:hypothetical protein